MRNRKETTKDLAQALEHLDHLKRARLHALSLACSAEHQQTSPRRRWWPFRRRQPAQRNITP